MLLDELDDKYNVRDFYEYEISNAVIRALSGNFRKSQRFPALDYSDQYMMIEAVICGNTVCARGHCVS